MVSRPSWNATSGPQGNGVETIGGYQWQQADSSGVVLFFFSVEQGKNSYTTVSVHYRAELPEAAPPEPKAATRSCAEENLCGSSSRRSVPN
jgi:hypothetical protein